MNDVLDDEAILSSHLYKMRVLQKAEPDQAATTAASTVATSSFLAEMKNAVTMPAAISTPVPHAKPTM